MGRTEQEDVNPGRTEQRMDEGGALPDDPRRDREGREAVERERPPQRDPAPGTKQRDW